MTNAERGAARVGLNARVLIAIRVIVLRPIAKTASAGAAIAYRGTDEVIGGSRSIGESYG